ncbi:BTAD domain-containing putative transcriptional regulator [Lentzea cavernae]|nr:BTAD domain-containing putative transcriptional regulator [Lentzea cavernae]
MGLRLDLFGSVRARIGGDEVELGSAQRRALLAVLALQANQVVTRTELIDALWGEKPPSSASGSVYTFVSSLRAALESESAPTVLVSEGSGYCLRLGPDAVDVFRFEELRETGRRRERDHDRAGALAAYASALELAAEEPLAGLPGPFVAAHRDRLRELRLDLVERRARLLLETGEAALAVSELSPVAAGHPGHEGLQSILLLALHRCGRREEALRLFEELRTASIEDFGTEPGPGLCALRDQIAANDPALLPAAQAAARTLALQPPEVFVGREDELAVLRAAVARLGRAGEAVLVEGEPGIGKTALLAVGLSGADHRIAAAAVDGPAGTTPLQVVLDALAPVAGTMAERHLRLAEAARAVDPASPDAVEGLLGEVESFVEQVCAAGPLVLVTDDLQWADPLSLRAWERLAALTHRLPLLLTGACRQVPGHRAPELARLACAATVLTVAPLPSDQAFGLAERLAGAIDVTLLDLVPRAAGNPRYLLEVVAGAAAAEPPVHLAGPLPVDLPECAVTAIAHSLGFLAPGSLEVLRRAALLGGTFALSELAIAAGGAGGMEAAIEELLSAGLLVTAPRGLAFRHPAVQESLLARFSRSIRIAMHRELAEALDSGRAPVERVAAQLLAGPVPPDRWVHEWLTRSAADLAAREPYSALRLLWAALASGTAGPHRDRHTVVLARLKHWLGSEMGGTAGRPAGQSEDPAVRAEMRWLMAVSHHRRGDRARVPADTADALADPLIPAVWRHLHVALASQARCQAGARRSQCVEDRVEARYLAGRWDELISELSRVLDDGPAMATMALGHPTPARRLSGALALVTARRDRSVDAGTHLRAAWQGGLDEDAEAEGGEFVVAARATMAEQLGHHRHALEVLTALTRRPTPLAHRLMPSLVRLAVDLGEHDQAKYATLRCERAPDQAVAALRCRALLDHDPLVALAAAAMAGENGDELDAAEATEDAAVLFARNGLLVEATSALRTAVARYQELGAHWDVRRAAARTKRAGER